MVIACVYIPHFAVQAECQRRSDIASEIILIGDTKVLDCSRAAEALGVKSGMRTSAAIALCDYAVVLPADTPYYQRRFEEVLALLEGFSPEVAADGSGTAYVSLKGLRGGPQAFAQEIMTSLRDEQGFTASVGVAPGKFSARVAACEGEPGTATVVQAGQEGAFLATLAVSHLPAGEAMLWRLHLLGIERMGDISQLPLGAFQQQFGLEGKRCWELANGLDSEAIQPRTREEVLVQRLGLPSPVSSLEAILKGVERLLHGAYAKKVRKNRWVRKAVVRGGLENGGSWEIDVPFRQALANPVDAWGVVKTAITRSPPERPVEELEVELVGLAFESGKQTTLMIDGNGKQWQQIGETSRQLDAQQNASLGTLVEVEASSRIPEQRMVFVAADSESASAVR